jgi:hypothetical protein
MKQNINYWCDCAIYDEPQLSNVRIQIKDFLIVQVPTCESMKGIFICSFQMYGYGFFLENKELSENLQVYKATDDRDCFYTINRVTDKNIQYTKTIKAAFNKRELLSYLTEYFEGLDSFFVEGYTDSIVKGFYEFIK